MEDDEDDFYGAAGQNGDHDQDMSGQPIGGDTVKAENMEMSEEEEEDSDDDVQFTFEKPEGAEPEAARPTRAASKAVKVEPSTTQQPRVTRQSTAPQQGPVESKPVKSELLHNGKEGKDFPEYRMSSVDVEQNPEWPDVDKKITDLDIDADLAEHSKPWRLPGTDVTDFFNYGFDEYTWTQYCAKQQNMSNTISELKDEDTRMKSMLGGMPNMSEGMPDMNQMMQMMMGGGGGGGMGPDASKMDFGQMMMSMGMPGMPPGAPPQGAGFGGSISPMPQAGQGFQAPPGMQNAGNMEGFSSQQMAIMQQEQQGHQGGGRGRGRRGRGYY